MDLFTSSEISDEVFTTKDFADNCFHFSTPPSGSDDGYWTDSMSSLSPSSIFSGQNSSGEFTDFSSKINGQLPEFSCTESSHVKGIYCQNTDEFTEFSSRISGNLERLSTDTQAGTFAALQNESSFTADHDLFSLPSPSSLMHFPGNNDVHIENLQDELFGGFHEELVKQCEVALNGKFF